MANPNAQSAARRTDTEAPHAEAPYADRGPTHMLVRSRGKFFRRAGLRFTSEWSALALDQLTREQVTAIEREPSLDSRRCDFDEVQRHVQLKDAALAGEVSPAEMAQMIMEQRREIISLRERVASLEVKNAGDLPPKHPGQLPGEPPPNRTTRS